MDLHHVMPASSGHFLFYSSCNYHPQMAIEGNTIHLMYVGAPEDSESPLNDLNHTFYQKSTDFGKTWTSAYKLPESEGREGMIVAKGQNVYIVTNATGARHVVYYSHDSGKTWNIQDQLNWIQQGSQGYYNPNNYYSLAIAQDDPTGNHVYYTGCRFFFAETKDGFKQRLRLENIKGMQYPNIQAVETTELRFYLDDVYEADNNDYAISEIRLLGMEVK